MDRAESTTDEPLLGSNRRQDLQEMMREVGLSVEYWLPKLQEHLGVTCAQALQHLEEQDLQKLKSQAQHSWEKRALEKLLHLSHSNSLSKFQISQVKMIRTEMTKAKLLLLELRELLAEVRQGQEGLVKKKMEELRQAMDIPKKFWPHPENSQREIIGNMHRQLKFMEETQSHKQNLPDRDLVRWASGGLALQGIYENSHQKGLIENKEEPPSAPKEFLLFGPEQGTQMETREFISSQAESMFTQTMEKLGFSVTSSAKDGGWGFSLEAGMNHSKHSESKGAHQSHSEHSYFCSTRFRYVPLASCHFSIDQLQLSKATLQELKCIEDLLDPPQVLDRPLLLRSKTESFFLRFGLHANQGPLHLGGIYWWKAISEGFQGEHLAKVKQQATEALNNYIMSRFSGFGVNVAGGVDEANFHSNSATQSTSLQSLQAKFQLLVAQTGGSPEANGFFQWKIGLVASNKTWCVIDWGLQLVPTWDMIPSNHKSDFKHPLQVAKLLKGSYTAVTSLTAQIQDGELLCAQNIRIFLEDMKSWKVSDPENLSLFLGCILNYLQETEQTDTQLLLHPVAAGAGYHVEKNMFPYRLGCDELEFLPDKMQAAQNIYQEPKNICTHRSQAFLNLTGLTATAGVTAISPEEKTQHLAIIKHHTGQSWSKEVLSNPGEDDDWKNLEKELRLPIDGNYENTISLLPMDEVGKNLQCISHEKKQSNEPCNNENSKCEVTEDTAFQELLQRLGLEHYYPKRMSRDNFHLIHNTSMYSTQPSSEKELHSYFLQKLLVLDYELRYLVFRQEVDTHNHCFPCTSNQENEAFDPYEDLFEDNDIPTNPSTTNPRPPIHPMDIQMAILHCADDYARQYIFSKLSICQFALPILIPNPCNSQIEFTLWSLSQIRKNWQEARKSPKETINYKNKQMCHVSTPIVSFIRVGNHFSSSKSQIMNCLLSKHKHDIFFHRHCRGSTKDCLLMKGVVEVCWFCPGGEDKDRFGNCLTFTNLHGDAKEHKKQLTFLQEVSSLIVILMSTSDDNEENRKIVHDLSQSPKPLIYLLDNKEKTMVHKSNQKVRIGIRNRNEAELTEELITTITHLLELSNTALSMKDCIPYARKQGFLIDEDQRECKEAKEKAELLMALLEKEEISQAKENLLPIQGHLWHLWCKKDKELYHLREKGNQSIEQHKNKVETEKQRIRQQQLTKAFPPNDLMCSFLQILHHSETHSKLYFLQWLSVLLDNLTAGHLEKLNKEKNSWWSLIQTEKQKAPKSSKLQSWQNKVEDISKEISDCTLGIEHLLREAGQIYEALEEASYTDHSLSLSILQIAADLVISGVPIELMDGDASYVPLKWVAALFDKVSEKVGNKRLFVLSILGLQSSGKSTLLNALFGLQFTVSAGRCTRGAYMQLLKVEETFTEELGFDFVLVVDTEGLRAPELSDKFKNRDNELATFVIGLGNLTLINIFGENPLEMQDILQIVVQAFIRMKQVKISPSCLFIHQNVGDATAEDQTMEGRRHLGQNLDEMVALVAEQEQYSDVTCFNDVIKFDINTQVYYFAHLWEGNPPMAPPNPRYSHNVQQLKSHILMTAQQESRGSIMKISDVKFRVQDLWGAIVSENFIFSFRNTREVMAMSKLETMYNTWTWELRSHVLDLQNKLINQIKNGKVQTLTTNTLEAPVTKKYDSIKQELEKYFNEDSDSEILIQWKSNFENKLINLKEALILETKNKADGHISYKNNQEILDNKKSGYEKEILERSRELALTLKGKELNEKELQEKFNHLWGKWVSDVSSNVPPATEPKIEVESEAILLEYFKKEPGIVNILRNNDGKIFEIDYKEHIKMCKQYCFFRKPLEALGDVASWIERRPRNKIMQLKVRDEESIKTTTDHIFSIFNETIDNIQRQQQDYNQSHFHEILRIIEDQMKSASTEGRYTFTSKYKIDIASHLFQRATEKFKEIHKAFERANNPVNYLESKKSDFFMSFKISCQGASSITTFVDFLWHKLTPAVFTTIWGKMAPKIAGDIRATCPAFNGNRANLEKHILISLAEKENFDDYWKYIHDPESFFRNYIENNIITYCSKQTSKEKIHTFLKISLDDLKNIILLAIQESTAIAKDKSSTVSGWLDLFCDYLGSNLIFPRKDLISIEHQEIKDIQFLKQAMSEALDPIMNSVEKKYLSTPIEEMVPEIRKMLSEHLSGCWKQCPFCKAICTNTIPTHDGDHSVPFHRSKAVIGFKWVETDHFSIDFCTSSVASENFLIFSHDKIPFKNYRLAGGEYATWSITPDTSAQPYWKWFVCHFRSNLEEKYKNKFTGRGTIPEAWTRITKQDVLDDLKKQ